MAASASSAPRSGVREPEQASRDDSTSECESSRPPQRLGLIPAPELPERIAAGLAEELPTLLTRHTDDRHAWRVECVTDPLIGADGTGAELIQQAARLKHEHGWDYALCITDLPLFRDGRLIVAEASEACGVAVISQPALGASPLHDRLREATLHLINEMHHGSAPDDRERQQAHVDRSRRTRRAHGIRNASARQLIGSRLAEWLTPIRRVTPDDQAGDEKRSQAHETDQPEIDVRFISAAPVRGHLRLLAGMVRANRPWTIVPAFRRIVAVAFATGAYGLIFPTLWRLSAAYEGYRFVLLMVAAIAAMVIWLILDHGLWEPQRYTGSPHLTRLYNLTTLLTLLLGVGCYYAILFALFLVAVILFVPASLLEATVESSIGWWNFPALAWLATSVATVAGALGSSLESDETIRGATYGYRQQLRQRKVKARQQQAQEEGHQGSDRDGEETTGADENRGRESEAPEGEPGGGEDAGRRRDRREARGDE
ncbi:hypothetical protein QO259_10835 [Salinicola sp. JS01]|uniref:hypothetical protein n=1 Tax=Salinicola sp. JS01 TaxID=3050071 RepID=UPI00255B6768|nr:hypothetical protein [Salinicola sp. JS01]WIX31328.1 hypothetical protein QO259_10835 [Salinicola sp. JS01]